MHPAHQDYAENGDLFPANTPYLLVSRGSSGSDQPLLEAAAMILAAFRPATKAKLIGSGLVVPTCRWCSAARCRTCAPRPPTTAAPRIRPPSTPASSTSPAWSSLANSIKPEDIPRRCASAIEEDLGTEGVDYFGEGLSEQLFDTPGAIARIWRSGRAPQHGGHRRGHQGSEQPAARLHWRLLQGDPAHVTIEPLDGGRRARITLDWQDPAASRTRTR